MKIFILLFAVTLLIFIICFSATANDPTEVHRCSHNSDCGDQQCASCISSQDGVYQKCTRLIPNHPYTTKGTDKPFNRYSWLTTRRSYASGLHSIPAPKSQEDSITDQLNNGIRGLMLDIFDYEGDIWLCFFICSDDTAFQLAVDALIEVRKFLESSRLDIITIFLEDHVKSPDGLNKLFDRADLRKFWFPASQMPKYGSDWPIINDMIKHDQRLVVFTTRPEKEASEAIAFKWNYIVDNQYIISGNQNNPCQNRVVSYPMNSMSRSLVMVNHFRSISDIAQVCHDNSQLLINKVNNCVAAANRSANFIAIDFYRMSKNGEVAEAIDMANHRGI